MPGSSPKRLRTIAFLISDFQAPMARLFWRGACEAAAEREIRLVGLVASFLEPPGFRTHAETFHHLVDPAQVDGIILWSSPLLLSAGGASMEQILQPYRALPTVVFGQGAPADAIVLVNDDYRGMSAAVRHLVDHHQRRRVAFIRGPDHVHVGAAARYQAYADVLTDHGIALDPALIVPDGPGSWDHSTGAAGVTLLIERRGVSFDALVCCNDYIALGALKELQARGISVPGQVALIGYDNEYEGRGVHPQLTSIDINVLGLGRRAVDLLVAKLDGVKIEHELYVENRLVLRESCGCMPHGVSAGADDGRAERGADARGWRERITQALAAAPTRPVDRAAALIAGEILDARDGGEGRILAAIGLVRQHGDVSLDELQQRLRDLKPLAAAHGGDADDLRLETLWGAAQRMVADAIQVEYRHQIWKLQAQPYQLYQTLGSLAIGFDTATLTRTLGAGLRRLGIAGCSIFLFEGVLDVEAASYQPRWSRCIFSLDARGIADLPAEGRRVLTQSIIPNEIPDGDRSGATLAELLFFEDRQIGVALLGDGAASLATYDLLRMQISSALEGERLVRHQNRRAQQLEQVAGISQAISAILAPEALPQRIVELMRDGFGFDAVGVLLLDRGGRELHLEAEVGALVRRAAAVALDHPDDAAARCARSGRPEESRVPQGEGLPDAIAQLHLPLVAGGQLLGVICIQSARPGGFSLDDVHIQSALAQQTAVSLQNARLYQRLADQTRVAELAREEAELLNRTKGRFLANISHELRTPLGAILSYVQLLSSQAPPERMGQQIHIIEQTGQHLMGLIEQLLDLARIESGRLELHPTTTPLHQFLDGMLGIMRARAALKQIALQVVAEEGLPPVVHVDEVRLRQVLLNLLSNAIKFTDIGHVILRVSLAEPLVERASAALLRFEVADTGVGMTPEQRAQIFHPFTQTGDVARRYAGTGLGLAISRELVHLMGGVLQVSSTAGYGSVFWFDLRLPLAEAAAETPRVPVGYRGPQRRVLVVDEPPGAQAILCSMLIALGFLVDTVRAQDAVARAGADGPDLIVLGSRSAQPGADAVRDQLRATPRLRDIPVIIMAAGRRADHHAAAAGAQRVLVAPVQHAELIGALEALLSVEWVMDAVPLAPDVGAAPPMVMPPASELRTLRDLGLMGDVVALLREAARIAELDERYRPFALQVQLLTRSFNDTALLRILEQALNDPDGAPGA
jgi:signal transduction histidine kinase/DNA-binding LacI/PurR family transcriptional regulator/CheY-like chemotaxis protein